jgi:hypothetical protein
MFRPTDRVPADRPTSLHIAWMSCREAIQERNALDSERSPAELIVVHDGPLPGLLDRHANSAPFGASMSMSMSRLLRSS